MEKLSTLLVALVPLLVAVVGVVVGYRGRVREEIERADREREGRDIAERAAYRRQNVLRRVLTWHHRVDPPETYRLPQALVTDMEEETE